MAAPSHASAAAAKGREYSPHQRRRPVGLQSPGETDARQSVAAGFWEVQGGHFACAAHSACEAAGVGAAVGVVADSFGSTSRHVDDPEELQRDCPTEKGLPMGHLEDLQIAA
mmetsp:Transcript_45041/g.97823  ORF Transcript_45041/g.97823 Transcript_45041/m.97823 type:complete len:112 (-) Transcript_45041:473-808(-)